MDALLAVARERCAGLAGGSGEFPFGPNTEVYKVGGKMFAMLTLNREPVWLGIKLPPAMGAELRAAFPDTAKPGYYMNKVHWNTLLLDGEPAASELSELVGISYELVRASLPRRIREQLPSA
ncbi:MmcQ/YjbR family DNA-binding protein [Micromonospora chokoriensis]